MCNVGKGPFCYIRTVVQMSVRILVVWSVYALFVDIYYNIHRFCKRATKAQISLRKCAGWSGPALSANCIGPLFVRCACVWTARTRLAFFFSDVVHKGDWVLGYTWFIYRDLREKTQLLWLIVCKIKIKSSLLWSLGRRLRPSHGT